MSKRSSSHKRIAPDSFRKVTPRRRNFALEPLEDRRLLAAYVVNNPTDTVVVGKTNLRQAIDAANVNGVANTITFDSTVFATSQTIVLGGTQLELSNSSGLQTITGPTAGVTVSGGGLSRVFAVDAGASVSMSGITITQGNGQGVGGSGRDGGAIYSAGTLTLTGCTISNSTTIGGFGAGVKNDGSLTLTGSTVSGNTNSGFGGGIMSPSGTVVIDSSTFSNNSADRGAGVMSGSGGGGSLTITNSTFTGNTARVGAAIDVWSGMTLTSSTLSLNTATAGGAGQAINSVNSLPVVLNNDIIANNSGAGHNFDGNAPTGSNNIFGDSNSTGSLTNTIIGDPQLAPLANNGSPNQTMALLPNSPAINAGNPATASVNDERGLVRFGNSDIGAFEYQFKVTTTADSGNGSLRQAITNANNTAGTDTVVFKIGTGQQTISPTSVLPTITDPIVIDGTTQPGFSVNHPLIQIDGLQYGLTAGLVTTGFASGSTFKGLIVSDFATSGGSGFSLTGNNMIVQGNWIGLNATGTAAAPNYNGISILGSGDLIGTSGQDGPNDAAERNVISGNLSAGVFSSGSVNLKIAGNYIGTNVAGNAPLNNVNANVFLSLSNNAIIGVDGSASASVDERNVIDGGISVTRSTVIAGNYIGVNAAGTAALSGVVAGAGITFNNAMPGARIGTNGDNVMDALEGNVISGFATGIAVAANGSLVIAGNDIGTSADGKSAIPNQVGIGLGTSTSGVRIGTNVSDLDFAKEGNLISGNTVAGVSIATTSNGNIITGNTIGLSAAGTALPNATGISIGTGSSNNTIGGTLSGQGNVISSNSLGGVAISTGSGNVVEGNWIGTDKTGTPGLGNTQFGIQISSSANNTIGGMAAGAGNVIAATKVLSSNSASGWGINVVGAGSSGSVIQGNTIGGEPAIGGQPGMGNAGAGIADEATITIGGILNGQGNVIGFNGAAGISLSTTASANSHVRQNSIIGNVGGGIAIGVSGAAYQHPVLTHASIVGGVLKVQGSAQPGAMVEFYVSASGQGATYLGTATEGSLADNNATSGSFDFAIAIPAGATASAGNMITAISVATPTSPTNPALQDTTSTFASPIISDAGPAFGAPVVNAGGGGTIVAGSTFSSQGSFTDTTSQSWTATVDYGDGSVPQTLRINPVSVTAGDDDNYSLVASGTFNLSHVFNQAGSYPVVVKVKNDSGLIGTSTFTVNVAAAPPVVNNTDIKIAPASNPTNFSSPTIINENQSVKLTGKFADANANPNTTHTVNIIWGDGSTSTATVDETAGTFSATHTYLAPGTYNSASGVYTVQVAINSSVGTATSTTFGLFYVQVNDVAPSNLVLTTDNAAINEGDAIHLSGAFQAPGPLDTHVVTINWGDNSPVTTLNLAPGVTSFSAIAHRYLDYTPASAGTPDYTISVSVNDLYQPLSPAKATAKVLVNPVAPSQVVISPSVGAIVQGQAIALSGSFVAPGPLDRHVVSIDWGDKTKPTSVLLAPGVNTFSGITHTYAKNSLLQAGGAFAITVKITDPAQSSSYGSGTSSVIVHDIASTVSNLAATYLVGGAIPIVPQPGGGSAPQVNAGTTVRFTGSFTTPNPSDSYAVLVSWGDGTTSTIPTVYLSSHTFVANHLYGDHSSGVALDDIHVTVTDTEGTTGSGDYGLAVAHINPVEHIASGGIDTSGSQVLSAQPSGDISPIASYSWTVSILNGPFVQSSSSPTLTLPSAIDTDYLVQSTVTDSFGAVSNTFTAVVHVLDNTSSSYMIPSPGAGVDAVIVSALSGNHVIDGSGTSVPIIFDGNGQETYIGNSANDVFNLHTDGSIGYGNGGNNIFNLTPNCTLQAVANGGQNTLNFSSSSFGVTFDLTQTQGQMQVVAPGTDAQGAPHVVAVTAQAGATFSTLVDSGGGSDTITAASNTTIVGMGGKNTVLVNSSNSSPVGNVTVAGAADGDTLVTSGPNVGSINFQGDTGADVLDNTGTITGTVTFGGGADSGTLNNTGTITGSVNFGGGADGGTFNNSGDVTGTLTFGGSADTNTLINTDTGSLGTVVFNGDEGANSFTNSGTVDTITYNGGSDGDTFTNSAAGTISDITYNAGSDAGTLTNSGQVTGSITYNGGADAGTIVNNGTVTDTVTFGGGSDADSFTNSVGASVGSVIFTGGADAGTLTNDGTVAGSITFSGGSDADTIVNNGTVTGSISFGGGSDAGTIVNTGTVAGTVTYGGGSDADSFTNSAGASVGSVVFTGGADAGTLTNNGNVAGSITYSGGSDSGKLVNTGTITGTVTYNGGSDADTLNNQGLIVGGVSYVGGSDAGSFSNSGTVTGTVTYSGGSDTDSFTNSGTLGTVIFTGGADSSTLTNSGAFGSITYTGGSDSNTFINTAPGGIAGTVNFQGDDGVDQFVNLGTLAGVTYTGGSDSDTLLNPGTITGTVVFNGDSGADLFENGATTVSGTLITGTIGSITFNAGADTDTLYNPGTVTGAIVFNGDAQATNTLALRQLINTGSAASLRFNGDDGANQLLNTGSTGSITFNGGADTNLLVNQGAGVGSITFSAGGDANVLNNSGSGFGTIVFTGDDGTDLLVNSGSSSAGSTSTITYNGGSDAGTLVNTGSGLGSITYTGGSDTSTLINTGSNVGTITYTGASDGSAFLNAGNSVSTITYTGGSHANVFRNDGTQVGTINYKGHLGSGYLLNNGSVTTINYAGGSDSDTLVNNGTAGNPSGGPTTGGINFTGDTGADGLLNTSVGTINGLVFTGGSDSDTLVNQGALNNGTLNFQGDDGAGQFVNQLGGTASNITYNAGSDTDALINYGSLSDVTYNGDTGAGSMYLDGTLNQHVTYNGGADGDELIIGPDAGVVSTINFNGDGGADLLANEANGASNITFQAGSDTATFWNFANNVMGLTFRGGPGADTFNNSGTNVTGIVFNAHGDTGADSLTNTGTDTGTIVFSGGSDANTLVNTGDNTASIVYNAGSDTKTETDTLTNSGSGVASITFNGDGGVDTVVNTGSSVGTITYNGGSDSDTLTNSGTVDSITFNGDGPTATFTDSGSVGTLVFHGGAGSASLIYSAIGASSSSVTFTGQGGGNIFVDSGSAGSINVNLGSGNNQAVVMTGASGNVNITGGDGNNTYLFSGTPTANVTVNQGLYADAGSMSTVGGASVFVPNPANPTGSGGGINTLDFSGYTGGNLTLDLMVTAAQTQPNGLSLTLTDREGISDVVGTQYSDKISGNLRPDVISTADLPDSRVASQENIPTATWAPDARTQWVYLDFDTYTVAGDHVYTSTERAAILSRIELDYYGPDPTNPGVPNFAHRWFDVSLTNNRSDIPSNLVTSGQYATLYFNRTPPSGLPGGEASEVDLGNRNFSGYASIQINGMTDGGGQPPSIDPVTGADNFATLTAKIGAHELAHLMGVRHSDSFGPIGFGLHTPPGTTDFNPTYDGADSAFETFDHIISSPATVGSTRFNDLRSLDFGPRESIKLAFASQGTTIVAPTGTHSSKESAESISLAPLTVPNTDVNLPDVEKGLNFQVAALDVEGTIGPDSTGHALPDYYAFSGQKGDVYTFEIDSQELARLGGVNTIDSVLTVCDSLGNAIVSNDDQFEGTDSLLLDVTLPATGTYYVKVASFAASSNNSEYDPTSLESPLNPNNLQSILNPLNPNFSRSALTNFLNAKNGTATGQYDLFMYRFAESDPTAADVQNTLVSRSAGTTLSGSTKTDTLSGPSGTIFNDDTTGPGGAISITAAVASGSVDLQSHFQDTITVTGTTGLTVGNVTISYGDGSTTTTEPLGADGTIALDHLYQTTGNDTVTVTVPTDAGSFEITVPVSVVLAQSPTEAINSPASGTQIITNQPTTFTGTLQNPYVGVNYVATWTFTNTANPSQVFTTSQTISAASAMSSMAISTTETFATAGTYSVQLSIQDLANNTSTAVQTIGGNAAQVVVIQFIATTTTLTAPNATYNGTAYSQASASVVGADQTVVTSPAVTYAYYNASDSGLTSPLGSAPTNAGSYLAVAIFAGNSLYTASQSQPVAFTIGQASAHASVTGYSLTYDGSAHTASGSAIDVSGNALPASDFTFTSTTHTNAGNYNGDSWSFSDPSGNYVNASGTVNDSIGQADAHASVTGYSLTYDGNAHTATGSATDVSGNALPASDFMLTSTTHTNAGTYNGDSWSFSDPSGNYAAASGTVNDAIGQANAHASVTGYSLTYDGNAHTATASATGVNGQALPASDFTLTSTTHTNSGTYNGDSWSFSDPSGNYAAASGTVNDSVSQAVLTVTANSVSKVYGAANPTFTAALTGFLHNDASSVVSGSAALSSTATISSDAGNYGITAAAGSLNAVNYSFTFVPGTLTVTAANTTTSVSGLSNSIYWNTSVTFTATVSNVDSGNAPTGSAEFYDGSADLGHGTLQASSGNKTTWTFTTSALAPGSHSITAGFTPTSLANGADFVVSNSQTSPYSETILGGPTTTTGSASSTIFYGQAETLAATVLSGSTPMTGMVDFYDNTTGTDLGTAVLNSSGVATLNPSVPIPAGTNSISMSYAGGNGYTASSTTVSVVVQPSIYVLNTTASGALNMSGSSAVSVPGTVQVASNSSMAIVLTGTSKITASTIGEVGGKSVASTASISGTQTSVSSVSDPLTHLPVPSATGLNTFPAVNLSGSATMTISPGIYPSIKLSGSARLTMSPGIYVINGGGFSVSGGSVTGSGVFIYNAGSNYNGGSGNTFGAVNVSGGTISLSPMTTGIYAGIGLFQSRDDTRALAISSPTVAGIGGVVYAPSTSLQLTGAAPFGAGSPSVSSLIVNMLVLSGGAGAYQLDTQSGMDGSDSSFNWITDPVLTVTAEDDTGEGLDPNQVADVTKAMAYVNQALASFGVNLSWAPSDTNADVTLHFAATTPAGGASDGVLGFTTPQNDVYFVTGWNYYTGSDASQIGSNQYDFTTLAIHELGHSLGLGESQDPTSVMYEYLTPGSVRRTFTDSNLTLIDTDADRFMKASSTLSPQSGSPGPIALTSASLSIKSQAVDAALIALDDSTLDIRSMATSAGRLRDSAIEAMFEEDYVLPPVIATNLPAQASDAFLPGSVRRPKFGLS